MLKRAWFAVVGLVVLGGVAHAQQPGESDDARVKRIVPQILADVVRIRGLAKKHDVPAGAMDRAALRAYFDEEMAREFPDQKFEELGRAWSALGLLPPETDLRAQFLDLLQGQVAGFYDPRSKRFYLVAASARDAEPDPMQKMVDAMLKRFGVSNDHVVIAHELTHALQDQHFDLEHGVHAMEHEDDRVLAAKCLVEGDATHLMNEYLFAKAPALRAMAEQMGGGAATQDLDQMAAMQPNLADKPRALWVPLVFPYVGGLEIVKRAHARGGWKAVDAMFADPPASTEQVLHPEKYFTEQRDEPVALRFAASVPGTAGWTVLEENTMGELVLDVWLREMGVDKPTAQRAAAGWGGDRYRVWATPEGGTVAAIATQWDTAEDALEFAKAHRAKGALIHSGRRVVVVRGAGAAGADLAVAVLGGLEVERIEVVERPRVDPEPPAGDRVRLDGCSAAHPGDDWQVQQIGHDGPVTRLVFDHHEVDGARIEIRVRGAAESATDAVQRAMAGLRDAGIDLRNVQRLRVGDTSPTACEARFTAEGERWVLLADVVGGRLVTIIGRTPPMRGTGVRLPEAVRRMAAGLRAD